MLFLLSGLYFSRKISFLSLKFKLVVLVLTIFAIYCSILLLNNEPLPTAEEITEQLTPDKETQEAIKDALEDAEKEIKKRYEDLND